MNYRDFFDGDKEGKCPPLTTAMVHAAEEVLGYRLPAEYIELLKVRNGGYLKRSFFPTSKCPRWADDHVLFDCIYGIGTDKGIDSRWGSRYLIGEWGYPATGVVVSSDGHTAFMLDYSKCDQQGEPRVIWVDVETDDGAPTVVELAPTFSAFLNDLREPPDE